MTTQRTDTPARLRVGLRLTEAEHSNFAAAALGAGFASPSGEGAIGPWLRSLGAHASHPRARSKATTDPLLQEWRERRVWDTIPADRSAIARSLGAAAALRPVVAIGPPEKRWWCPRSDGKGGPQTHAILTPPTGPADDGWRYFVDGTYRVPVAILSELVDGEFVVAEVCP